MRPILFLIFLSGCSTSVVKNLKIDPPTLNVQPKAIVIEPNIRSVVHLPHISIPENLVSIAPNLETIRPIFNIEPDVKLEIAPNLDKIIPVFNITIPVPEGAIKISPTINLTVSPNAVVVNLKSDIQKGAFSFDPLLIGLCGLLLVLYVGVKFNRPLTTTREITKPHRRFIDWLF